MISESYYWKSDLQKIARSLNRRCSHQKRWPAASLVKIEQEVMVGCFIIRKLMDAYKITAATTERYIKLHVYDFNGSHAPDYYNWRDIVKHYNIKNKNTVQLSLRELCNQVIHSFVFIPAFDNDNSHLHSLLFSSDKRRKACLYEIESLNITNLFFNVADDCPTKSISTRGDDGQWHIIVE